MAEENQEKTTFISHRGTYCYKVMSFGLKNEGATYQRLVTKIFEEQLGKTMEVYIDDMLVKSTKKEDHIGHLKEAFEILRQYGMKLNPEKCAFSVTSGKFLGFLVSQSCIEVNPDQIRAIEGIPEVLTSKKQVLVDFVADFSVEILLEIEQEALRASAHTNLWVLYTNDASNASGSGLGLILEVPTGERLQKYQSKIHKLLPEFDECRFDQIPRAQNIEANDLAKLAVATKNINKENVVTLLHYAVDHIEPNALGQTKQDEYWKKYTKGTVAPTRETAPFVRCLICAGYYWPTMKKEVADYVRRCEQCQKYAPMIHQAGELLHSITSPWTFIKWGMDIVGPLPAGRGNVRFLLGLTDYFYKWVEAGAYIQIREQEAITFIWKNIICCFCIPKEISCDNGPQFVGKKTTEFFKKWHIKRILSTPYHPAGNGQAESSHKVILSILKKKLEDAKWLWTELLPEVLWAYHTTPKTSTGKMPYSLVYGTDAVIPVEVGEPSLRYSNERGPSNDESRLQDLDEIEERRDVARIRMVAQKQQAKRYYNKKAKVRPLKVGDYVLKAKTQVAKDPNEGKLGRTIQNHSRSKQRSNLVRDNGGNTTPKQL
uniref:Uncharacterized protein K02A2.6-like n=1 Tax=Nicotiana tabacum TaxID=4097 RepID=A0A1S4BZN6_TOBAC|nr:PREDICTED: uncharacterized protein K02A2.6-like [Nicotiana tabacum]